jgi:hypothetical protein
MRPFEANGIVLGLDDLISIDFCGQWVSRKLVQ